VFERIRRRLTLAYVGIFALILVLVGAVAVVSFSHTVAAQQDELLEQKAQGDADFVVGLLRRYQEERDSRGRHQDGPPGPFQWATGSDIGMLALVPPSEANGEEGTILDSTSSASSFGLPFEEPARRATQNGETVKETLEGPGGEEMRVVSVPVADPRGEASPGGEVAVIQAAQSRQVVRDMVRSLVLVLVPIGIGGLLLAGAGGLYMSRRAMQPVRDSFQRQRTFIADASHELKTPLSLVKIDAEVMQRNPADPSNREIVEDQLSEIDRMNALLSDLLTLARLDAGRLDVEGKPFDLAVVAAEAAGRFLTRAAEEGVRLEVETSDELSVWGDPGRTAQILATLLDNAVRYTPKGGSITVSGRLLDGRAETSVADDGPGIPPEHLPRIFDRFYRAEEARNRAGGGAGLGLSIAHDLARAQGGALSAENAGKGSADGGGAIFRLQLPRQ
jgi:signal transduction histidine kinase